MNLFDDLALKFERSEWNRNTLIDTIPEQQPYLIKLLADNIMSADRLRGTGSLGK